MNKYIKGYSLGVLLGLLFCSSAFVVDVSFSFKQHWYTLVIFLPAVLYFIFSYSEYNEVSFKKENIKKSIPFIIGLVLSSYAIYSIWGLPYLWKKFNLIKSSEKQKSQETLLNQQVMSPIW